MSSQSELKTNEIDEFLNESFMVLDECADKRDSNVNHNTNANGFIEGEGSDNSSLSQQAFSSEDKNGKKECNPLEEDAGIKKEQQEQDDEVVIEQQKTVEVTKNSKDTETVIDNEATLGQSEIMSNASTLDYDKKDSEVQNQPSESLDEVQQEEDENEDDDAESVVDNHPYIYLIENFEFTKEQKTITDIGPSKSLTDTPLHIISSRGELIKLLQTLKSMKEISLDIQLHSREFQGCIALLAISTRDADYVIDAMKLKNELLLLTEIFINPKIVKIIFKSEIVLSNLQQYLHLFVVNVFDVNKAGLALHAGKHGTLYTILRHDFGYVRDLKLHQADFRTRPLSEYMKNYCRSGAHYLIHIYHNYKNRLIKQDENLYKNLLTEFRETCKILFPDRKTMMLQSMEEDLKKRHNCQLDVLQKLFLWRHNLARKNNKNPEAIIGNSALINLAGNLPTFEKVVLAFSNSQFVKKDVEKILGMISESKLMYQIPDKKPKQRKVKKNEDETNKFQATKRKADNTFETVPIKQKRIEPLNVFSQRPMESTFNNKHRPNKKTEAFQKKMFKLPNNRQFLQPNFAPSPIQIKNETQSSFRPNSFLKQSLNSTPVSNNFNQGPSRGFNKFNKSRFEFAGVNNRRKDDFTMAGPKVFKSTNVPSNVHFQPNNNPFKVSPFEGPGLNRFQTFNAPRNNFGGAVETEEDVLRRCLSTLKNTVGNFGPNRGQGPRYNDFDQALNAIDQKINTLERKVTEFQVRNNSNNDMDVGFRRRY